MISNYREIIFYEQFDILVICFYFRYRLLDILIMITTGQV